MKRRIISVLTSLLLIGLVALALIFVPFEASSDTQEKLDAEKNSHAVDSDTTYLI
jgi:hypothetical protein